jgi:site-specific recombinase XerD
MAIFINSPRRCVIERRQHQLGVPAQQETASGIFRKLYQLAGIKGNPHRFRVFALDLPSCGVSLKNVSVLLGHSSIRITEKHCARWVKPPQLALAEVIKKIW